MKRRIVLAVLFFAAGTAAVANWQLIDSSINGYIGTPRNNCPKCGAVLGHHTRDGIRNDGTRFTAALPYCPSGDWTGTAKLSD